MGKRSSRRVPAHDTVQYLFPNETPWDPLGEPGRDKSYVKKVRPYSEAQRALLDAIDGYGMVLALGPAGTGKTYLSIAKVGGGAGGRRGTAAILLCRPAIEAGESLGASCRATSEQKLAPYLRPPLYDALTVRLGRQALKCCWPTAPSRSRRWAYMRGCTLNNSFIVIDEAQNCTYGQLKLLLTRLGWHSIHGADRRPRPERPSVRAMSGFADIARRLDVAGRRGGGSN